MSFRDAVVLCLLPFSAAVSHTLEWYERLPQPEEVRAARSIEELLPYLDESTTDARLTIHAMIRIAEIGGEEAADALCRFYESNDSGDSMEDPVVRKAIALRLIGRVGGERAKRTLLIALNTTIHREQSPSAISLRNAATEALGMLWQDAAVYDAVDSLFRNPPESLGPVGIMRLSATLLVMNVNRGGIDSLKNQIDYLLDQVKGPGFGAETIVSPERYEEHAYMTEAVRYLLSFRYGSRALPHVEHYLAQRGNTLPAGSRDAIDRIVGRLHLIAEAEKRETEELERIYDALNQPGARLVVVEENGWRKQKLVFADSARADRRGEDEGWRQFFLGLASRPHSTSRDRASAYHSLALLAAKAGEWDRALQYYELMEKEDYKHAFTGEVDIEREKDAVRQRRYPLP